jgi:ABC-2 type transport system ATP-binding protein
MDLGTISGIDGADHPHASAGPATALAPAPPPPVMPSIRIQGITRRFGDDVALDGVSLDLYAGEVMVMLGPNGAGKTTTVRVLNGILAPDEGEASVLGFDVRTHGHEIRSCTGTLTENAGLDDRLTALENLEFTARIRGMPKQEATQKSRELLTRFGMGDHIDRRIHGFSTGQRKRIALARALIHDPAVLFLDEPTSGLDPAATRAVVDLIGALAHEQGRTVVLATHFLGEAARVADRLSVMHQGRIRVSGRPDELTRAYWPDLEVQLVLQRPAGPDLVGLLAQLPPVLRAESSPVGARVHVHDRGQIPHLVRDLAAREIPIFEVRPHTPTLEDIYFETLHRCGVAYGAADLASPEEW